MSSLTLGQAPKATATLAPIGTHMARCYAVIDCGTHTEDGAYGIKTNRKIRISWELPEELHTFKEERGPEPFSLSKTYNFTIGEKAALRQDLESWRGKPFTAEELQTFDMQKLVGVPCIISVIHNIKGEKTYANIDSIIPLHKSMKDAMPAGINAPVFFTVGDGRDSAVFRGLHTSLQEYIAKCAEWNLPPSNGLAANGSIQDEGNDSDF